MVNLLINGGVQAGPHVHDVFGGSGFSNQYNYSQLIQSNCTSMEITEDFSNYWVVSMTQPDESHFLLVFPAIYVLRRPQQRLVYPHE